MVKWVIWDMKMDNNISSGSLSNISNLGSRLKDLKGTQGRISTGLRVNSPKENSSIFAIAQQVSSDISGMTAIKSSLNQAEASLNTAVAAGQAANDLVVDMKSKAIQASQPGLDDSSRKALNQEFQQMSDQLNTLTSSASFNNTNLVQNGAEGVDILVSQDGEKLRVEGQDLSSQNLGFDNLSLETAEGAAEALSTVNAAVDTVSSAVSELGASASRIEHQAEFTTSLDNVLKEGLGNLVDADLGTESAKSAAEKVKVELGLKSLAIANAGPNAMKSLFPG